MISYPMVRVTLVQAKREKLVLMGQNNLVFHLVNKGSRVNAKEENSR